MAPNTTAVELTRLTDSELVSRLIAIKKRVLCDAVTVMADRCCNTEEYDAAQRECADTEVVLNEAIRRLRAPVRIRLGRSRLTPYVECCEGEAFETDPATKS